MSTRPMSPEKLNKVRRRLIFDDTPSISPNNPTLQTCDNHPANAEPNKEQEPSPLETINLPEDNLDELSQKYNFDFRNEVPLPGDWEWKVVEVPERVAPPDHKEVVRNLKEVEEFRDDRKV